MVRWGQPAIVGEMVAGIVLGPAVLGLVAPNAALSGISSLAVFLVVLSAGLEMSFRDIVGAMRGRGLVIALAAFALPFGAGTAVATILSVQILLALAERVPAWRISPAREVQTGWHRTCIRLHVPLQCGLQPTSTVPVICRRSGPAAFWRVNIVGAILGGRSERSS